MHINLDSLACHGHNLGSYQGWETQSKIDAHAHAQIFLTHSHHTQRTSKTRRDAQRTTHNAQKNPKLKFFAT